MIEVKERESGLIAIDDLKVYQNNARTHSDEQVQKICASFKEFGVINPVLIDENNMLLAGHGRLMAAEELSMDHINYIRINDLTENQKKAYVIADNQHALNADWDYDILKTELLDLESDDYDLGVTGFDDSELDTILNGWNSDIEIPEDVNEPDNSFTIKIKGQEVDRDDVLSTIERALKESGIEGLEIG